MAIDRDTTEREPNAPATDAPTTERVERDAPRERQEREPAGEREEEKRERKPKDIRATIKAAIKEHAEPPKPRPAPVAKNGDDKNTPSSEAARTTAAPEGDAEIPPKDTGTAKEATPEARPIAPPKALSGELKANWDKLDPSVRKEFARLEAESAKGIEQLKARYTPIDEALAPLRDELRAIGKTEHEGVRMLADWRNALRGPQKVQAFRALAQAEGIDLSQLAPRSQQGQVQQPSQQSAQNDPSAILKPYLDPLRQEVASVRGEFQRRDWERTQADIASFSKDKGHYDAVRVVMGHLIGNGIAQGSSPKEVFDDAYARACRADPEIFAAIQAEEQAKREAAEIAKREAATLKAADAETERKRKQAEEVERARKAATGVRGGAPTGSMNGSAKGNETVRDSLERARREVGSRI